MVRSPFRATRGSPFPPRLRHEREREHSCGSKRESARHGSYGQIPFHNPCCRARRDKIVSHVSSQPPWFVTLDLCCVRRGGVGTPGSHRDQEGREGIEVVSHLDERWQSFQSGTSQEVREALDCQEAGAICRRLLCQHRSERAMQGVFPWRGARVDLCIKMVEEPSRNAITGRNRFPEAKHLCGVGKQQTKLDEIPRLTRRLV